MPDYAQARWLRKGDFVDLEDVPEPRRPEDDQGNKPRFAFVKKQRPTYLRPIKFGSFISGGQTASVDQEGRTSNDNRMSPGEKNLIMQGAIGLKNDFKLWVENPTDHSMRSLPNEVPNKNNDVGFIRQEDSPYFEPSLADTEFWIVKDIADDPSFHAVKESGGPIEPTISLRLNELVLEPVSDRSVQQKLETRQLRSTPVDLKVEV